MIKLTRTLLCTSSLAFLCACGTKYSSTGPGSQAKFPAPQTAPSSTNTPDDERPAAPTAVSREIKPTSLPADDTPRSLPAAIALREQAVNAAADNDYSKAIGLLERAIRISPNDPATFSALAEIHLADNRPQQALELTRRALTLNPSMEQQLQLELLEQKCLALL